MPRKKFIHVSVGNFNLDVAVYLEVPVSMLSGLESIFAKYVELRPGGAATNYAVAAATYGHASYLVATISKSQVLEPLLNQVRSRGVNLDYVKYVDEDPGIALLLITPSGEKVTIRYPGANKYLVPQDVREELLEKAHVLHLASVNPDYVASIAEKAKKKQVVVTYDPGPYASMLVNYPELIKHLDVLFVNESEYSEVRKRVGLKDIFGKGLKLLAVKMGSKGALVVEGSNMCYYGTTTPVKKPVDTTGAGDAFDAFFNATYIETLDVAEALRHAIAAGTLKAGCKGSFICWDSEVYSYQLRRTEVTIKACSETVI